MLIEKEVDPLAGELFFKYAVPVWDKLNDEEKEMAKKFLEDPVEGLREILEYYRKESYEAVEIIAEYWSLLGMVKDYVEKRGWIWKDEKGKRHFIWRRWFNVFLNEDGKNFFPSGSTDLKELKEFKKALEELKEKGAEKFLLWIWTSDVRGIMWWGPSLYFWDKLTKEALGRVKEELTFKEAMKIVNWLYDRWKETKEDD